MKVTYSENELFRLLLNIFFETCPLSSDLLVIYNIYFHTIYIFNL